jgi:4-aminobutyrate aminotransferase-like enzyme/Ser/Thr protein kinase RdoA (MazF antagonist)
MNTPYSSIRITIDRAADIARGLYHITGDIVPLPGELDFNFRITDGSRRFVLKISRPDVTLEYFQFQQALLDHVAANDVTLQCPATVPSADGRFICEITDDAGNLRLVRLLSWIDGRLWSLVNPITDRLLTSLGRQAGRVTKALQGFDHDMARRNLLWDVARTDWTRAHLHLFTEEQQKIIGLFHKKFARIQEPYRHLRKSVVHNDVNDNNVVVTRDLCRPEVAAIIDYGDAVHTQTINDLAVTVAYAVMAKPDVLGAALCVVKGYHRTFALEEQELALLYTLTAMRLVISVTRSAINRKNEPDNTYLLVSEKPAWDVLEKWQAVDENFAHYSFRQACGFVPHPLEHAFTSWAKGCDLCLGELFSQDKKNRNACPCGVRVDLGVGSTWLGNSCDYTDTELLAFRLDRLGRQHKNALPAGGYLEYRMPDFGHAGKTDTGKNDMNTIEGNNGPEYRTLHLGIDIWAAPGTPIFALFKGTLCAVRSAKKEPDRATTLVLEHYTPEGICFYTVYSCLGDAAYMPAQNQCVEKGSLLGYVGYAHENGEQAPHLHFQVMLDKLGSGHDFPKTAFPSHRKVWKSICPDPNLFFTESALAPMEPVDREWVLNFRKQHLGKSLSLSYDTPLKIVRGVGAYLIDDTGRKYLDTVNNVAHAGHEHPRVVRAGQEQMAVLNTNTRYLHDNINRFAQKLLSTFAETLSVVHFVNSGSEANELALRMAKAVTGQRDMIAVEVGYHGNTSGCIDISSYKFDGKGGKGAPEHTHIVPLPDAFRGLYQGKDTGLRYAAHVNEQIARIHEAGRGVAGFICESIISCGGQIELPGGYLKSAYEMVRQAGGVCIADEVQVGCGRMGHTFWGFALHDVVPDIITIGKPIGNGHPLAAVVCTRAVADAFANGMEYFNTFGGNPVSCAIGLEVLQVIEEEHLMENALHTGSYLKKGLQQLQQRFPIIGDVRGQGLFLGFELVDENKHPLGDKADYLANRMQELGILMSTDGRDHNVLKIKPPAVFSMENADELLFRLETVLAEDAMAI